MASDMNSVAIVGRLGADPEVRTAGSTSVANLRLAVNSSRKTKAGDWEDRANWLDVKVWGSQAEAVGRNLRKGRRVGVTGRLEVEEWEKDDQRRSKVVVVASMVQYLDPKDEDGGGRREPARSSADEDIPF